MDIDTLKWLIDKQESLRTNNISRAGVVATVSTVIIAAYAFLSERASTVLLFGFSQLRVLKDPQFILIDLPIIIGLALTCVSLFLSLDAISHLSRRTKQILGEASPKRVLLHSRETIRAFPDFGDFLRDLSSLTEEELRTRLSAELWGIHHAHARCYEKVRLGAWLVVGTSVMLFIQYVAVLALKFVHW